MSRSHRRHSTPLDFTALIAADAAPGPSGTTFIPRERRYSANHSKSSGGSTRLDDHRDRQARVGDPASRPLPTSEVRQSEDDTGAVRDALPEVPEPLVGEVRGDLDVRERRDAERLDPVARVRVERPVDCATQRSTRQRLPVHPPEVTGDDVTPAAHRLAEAHARESRRRARRASREGLARAWRRPGRRRRRPVRQATVIRAWRCDGARPASAPWRWDGRPGGTASATARGRDVPRSPAATPSRTAAPP